MTSSDLFALSPLLVLAAMSVAVMLAIAIKRNHVLTLVLTLAAFLLSLLALPFATDSAPRVVTPLLIVDTYALFYMGLVFTAGAAVALLSYGYLERRAVIADEYYLLLLMASLGAATLVASRHFASFFLGLELLSVALFALIAYSQRTATGLEAGLKYLILSGVSSAFLLLGMALIYAQLGTMEFARMAALWPSQGTESLVLLAGLALIVTGIGFKLSVVPFHMWTPDVFEGAPAPIAGFLASVSKGGVFALLLRYFTSADVYRYGSLLVILALIAIASMLIGNLAALLQNNVKRILAYSSIAHLGYLLVTVLVGGALGIEAATYYLVAYFVTILAAFGVIAILSTVEGEHDMDSLDDYRGLFWRRPWLAGVFTAALLSLAGIPLTVGFVAKFYVIAAGVAGALWVPVIALIIGSAIGLFYYIRVLITLYTDGMGVPGPVRSAFGWSGGLALAALAVLLVALGVYPGPLMQLIHLTVARLG